ncbi:MAG: hypothetical protein K0S31_4667 [Sphingobacterium multivorum]|nr:hypothetical protein [Sphingobacterium multivorum]
MAKKAVASLQKGGGKEFTKVIITTKSAKTGAYTFKEGMVPFLKFFFKKNSIKIAVLVSYRKGFFC